jgi:hypothetical protein
VPGLAPEQVCSPAFRSPSSFSGREDRAALVTAGLADAGAAAAPQISTRTRCVEIDSARRTSESSLPPRTTTEDPQPQRLGLSVGAISSMAWREAHRLVAGAERA